MTDSGPCLNRAPPGGSVLLVPPATPRTAERRLRDLRGRDKAARTVAAITPGLAEVLASDWRKVAWFYARYGMTETRFRNGVPAATRE